MEQKRVCKVCGEEKNASIFDESMVSHKGWNVGTVGVVSSFLDDGPRFIPSPRMTIATAAMQGLLSNKYVANSTEFVAKKAVEYADALLNKLSEPRDGVPR